MSRESARVEIPGVHRRVEDHALGNPPPGSAAVLRPERLPPGARVERPAIGRSERERLDLVEAGDSLARAAPALPAVRRDANTVVAADGEHARLSGRERQSPRRHRVLRMEKGLPRRAAIVADDDASALQLPRDRGPESCRHGGIRDERSDVEAGERRARRERFPRRAGVARAVEVAARRPAVDQTRARRDRRRTRGPRRPRAGGATRKRRPFPRTRRTTAARARRPKAMRPRRLLMSIRTASLYGLRAAWPRRPFGYTSFPWAKDRFASPFSPLRGWAPGFCPPRRPSPRRCCPWWTAPSSSTSSRRPATPGSNGS